MFKKIFLYTLCIFEFYSCKKSNYIDGYTRDKNGFYYKLLSIGDGNENPKTQNILVLEAVMKTLSDSTFWDTKHDAMNGLYIELKPKNLTGSCGFYFQKLSEGDSVSFLVKPTVFFKDYFDTLVPSFCQNDSLIKFDIKLNQIISKAEYLALKKNAEGHDSDEDTELQELQLIDNYIHQTYKSVTADEYGIYTLRKTHTNLEKVSVGKHVKISYTGSFIDGKPVDIPTQEFEFIYGTSDQLIKGLNIVIGSLKKGETTKIIVPSRLAFGELGSSNGSIPPYTPLVYDIKIIDIK